MNRRALLKSTAATAAAIAAQQFGLPVGGRAAAQGASPVWRHGITKFGDLKYPPGFKQFDYVNAKAPKGGARVADRARHL